MKACHPKHEHDHVQLFGGCARRVKSIQHTSNVSGTCAPTVQAETASRIKRRFRPSQSALQMAPTIDSPGLQKQLTARFGADENLSNLRGRCTSASSLCECLQGKWAGVEKMSSASSESVCSLPFLHGASSSGQAAGRCQSPGIDLSERCPPKRHHWRHSLNSVFKTLVGSGEERL